MVTADGANVDPIQRAEVMTLMTHIRLSGILLRHTLASLENSWKKKSNDCEHFYILFMNTPGMVVETPVVYDCVAK